MPSSQAEDGQAALTALLADPSAVDVLVTDVEMPLLDGVELARRALAAKPDLKVLLISGHAQGLDKAADLDRTRGPQPRQASNARPHPRGGAGAVGVDARRAPVTRCSHSTAVRRYFRGAAFAATVAMYARAARSIARLTQP